jgi:hypothetical protein
MCLFGVRLCKKESLPTRVIVGFVVRPLRSSLLLEMLKHLSFAVAGMRISWAGQLFVPRNAPL